MSIEGDRLMLPTQQRRDRVEEMLLRGVTNQNQIAAALGTSQKTVCLDVQAILTTWVDERRAEDRAERKSKRVRQLEGVLQKAINSYERSCQIQEEVNTTYTPRKCTKCEDGMADGDSWCRVCGGTGTELVETVTRRVRGQAGDAGLLGKAIEAIREISKIEGVYPVERKGTKERDVPINLHLHRVDLSGVSGDRLIEAKRMLENLVGGGGIIGERGKRN